MLKDVVFTVSLAFARRVISLVDGGSLMLARLRGQAKPVPETGSSVYLLSAGRKLDGWLVNSSADRAIHPLPAGVLLLHGIGDKLSFWRRVQAMLASNGLTSLVFDYSGYGRSEGQPTQAALEQDAASAYCWLCAQLPPGAPVYLLGYSLGTGLAAEIAPHLTPAPAGVILCQSYTSFREAAARVLGPLRRMNQLVHDLWRTRDSVTRCPAPLLLIHGQQDALFPYAMAEEIHRAALAAGVDCTLRIIPGAAHNSGYLDVAPAYWAPVLAFINSRAA